MDLSCDVQLSFTSSLGAWQWIFKSVCGVLSSSEKSNGSPAILSSIDILLICHIVHVSIFTALHGMQTWSSDENSLCLSLRLSNALITTKRKNNLSRFLYHTKDHLT